MDIFSTITLPKLKKKHAILIIVLAISLITLFLIIFIVSRQGGENASGTTDDNFYENSAKIFILEGAPRVEKLGKISRTIQSGEIIAKDDVIVTDDISRAIILFTSNSSILIDRNTKLKINEIQTSNASFTKISLLNGSIFSRTEEGIYQGQNYEVKISNLVISSMGTRFESSISQDGKISNSVFKGKIKLININNNDEIIGEIEVNQNTNIEFRKDEIENLNTAKLNSYVKPFDADTIIDLKDENIFFKQLIICIDANISDILRSGNATKSAYLQNRGNDLVVCIKKVYEKILEKYNAVALEQAQNLYTTKATNQKKQPPELIKVSDQYNLTLEDKLTCSWSATGEEITGYEYSITSDSGSILINWTATTSTTITLTNIGMKYGDQYYCNVKAIGKYGTSSMKSSDGITFDNKTATIAITLDPNSGPPDAIFGKIDLGDFDNDTDLIVKVYLKNIENKYYDGTDWQDSIYWHETTKKPGTGSFTWKTNTIFPAGIYTGDIIYIQVTNTQTGAIIPTTFTVP